MGREGDGSRAAEFRERMSTLHREKITMY